MGGGEVKKEIKVIIEKQTIKNFDKEMFKVEVYETHAQVLVGHEATLIIDIPEPKIDLSEEEIYTLINGLNFSGTAEIMKYRENVKELFKKDKNNGE